MTSLRPHERLVLDVLLAGDEPILATLREQAASIEITSRDHTGVGEYVYLKLPADHLRVEPPSIVLGDIDLEIESIENGMHVLLYVEDGRLSFIEFVTNSGEWPSEPIVLGYKYLREQEISLGVYSLMPVDKRDPFTLARALRGPERGVVEPTAPGDTL